MCRPILSSGCSCHAFHSYVQSLSSVTTDCLSKKKKTSSSCWRSSFLSLSNYVTFHWFQELNFNILQLSNTIACKNPSLQLIQQNRHCCNFIESYLCIFSCYVNFFLFTILGLVGIVLHLGWSLRYIFYFCIAFIPNISLSVKYMWVFGLCLVLFLLAVSSMILLCKGTMFQGTSYPLVHTFFIVLHAISFYIHNLIGLHSINLHQSFVTLFLNGSLHFIWLQSFLFFTYSLCFKSIYDNTPFV